MHGRLDEINERGFGGVETAELDEATHAQALMGAAPLAALRRTIDPVLGKGSARHSAM